MPHKTTRTAGSQVTQADSKSLLDEKAPSDLNVGHPPNNNLIVHDGKWNMHGVDTSSMRRHEEPSNLPAGHRLRRQRLRVALEG